MNPVGSFLPSVCKSALHEPDFAFFCSRSIVGHLWKVLALWKVLGIGYQMLRIADSARVPSVLFLEGPITY